MSEEHLKTELDRFKTENKRLVAKTNEQSDRIAELEHTIRVIDRELAQFKEDEIRAEIEAAREAQQQRLRQTG